MSGEMIMTKPFYEVREFSDLREMLMQSVEIYGDKTLFEVKGGSGNIYGVSYKDFFRDVNSVGTMLCSAGFKGCNIAVAGQNSYKWILSYLSTVCGTGTIVPIDKELLFDEIDGILKVADVKLIFCDNDFFKKLYDNRGKITPGTKIVCFEQADDDEFSLSFDIFKDNGKKLLDEGDDSFTSAVIDPEVMCSLLFTSGTTGTSKGVMLSHRNFCSDVKHCMEVVKIYPEDKGISILPLHHTYECTVMMFMGIYSGGSAAFCDGLKYVVKNFKEYSPTVFVSVPLLLEKVHKTIMKRIEKKKNGMKLFNFGKRTVKIGSKFGFDLRRLFFKEIQDVFGGRMRLIIVGAAAMNPQIIEDFAAFGIQIIYGYGLTECSPLVICNNDRLLLTDSIGVPLPSVEVKIINKEPETGIGELCVRGPMVMLGYYKNPEETAKVIDEDGFFHTGDLGYANERGEFFITGRIKNVIVTKNGKNIYPEEIEYHIGQNRFVEECLVLEGKDKNGEPVVEANVYPNFDEIRETLGKCDISDSDVFKIIHQVIEEINKKLPSYKRVIRLKIRETEFIKNTTAKIQRFKNVPSN